MRREDEPVSEANEPVRLGLIEGDGIGPEIVRSTRAVVDEAVAASGGAPIDWVPAWIGHRAIEEFGRPLPERTIEVLAGLDAWVLGPHDNVSYPGEFHGTTPPGGAIRKRFDLFANIRPARAFPGVRAAAPGIDLVVVRENSEGFYADRNMFAGSGEFQPSADMAMSVSVITRGASERIAHEAMRLAAARRKQVTIVHKANVLPRTMGLFRDVCYAVAKSARRPISPGATGPTRWRSRCRRRCCCAGWEFATVTRS